MSNVSITKIKGTGSAHTHVITHNMFNWKCTIDCVYMCSSKLDIALVPETNPSARPKCQFGCWEWRDVVDGVVLCNLDFLHIRTCDFCVGGIVPPTENPLSHYPQLLVVTERQTAFTLRVLFDVPFDLISLPTSQSSQGWPKALYLLFSSWSCLRMEILFGHMGPPKEKIHPYYRKIPLTAILYRINMLL